MENRKKHACIISCDICLKFHKEILNRIDRAMEILNSEFDIRGYHRTPGDEVAEVIVKILRGESH